MKASTLNETIFDERKQAVLAAYDRYHHYLVGYATSLTRNKADAEDLVGQLWLVVLHHFKPEHIGVAILRRKLFQLFCDWYRKQKRRSLIQHADELPDIPSYASREAYSSAEENALRARFWAEVNADITEDAKELIFLYCRHGYTLGELAQRYRLPVSTVSDRLQKARDAVSDHLNRTSCF